MSKDQYEIYYSKLDYGVNTGRQALKTINIEVHVKISAYKSIKLVKFVTRSHVPRMTYKNKSL